MRMLGRMSHTDKIPTSSLDIGRNILSGHCYYNPKISKHIIYNDCLLKADAIFSAFQTSYPAVTERKVTGLFLPFHPT
jgi:hypothetical protein